MQHTFKGQWISNREMANLQPRNVFHRQLSPLSLDCSQCYNRHILFRQKLSVSHDFQKAVIFISADDYYKLYINGQFVAQGPAPSYHFQYNYNEIDISSYLKLGENTIAVHTYYQGLINRIWQSGDLRHGLICDVELDGACVLCSDENFKVAIHTGYTEMGRCGYQTQILERYDSTAKEVGFENPLFDDSYWERACVCQFDDHCLVRQQSHMLVFENIAPACVKTQDNRVFVDFGANYVGYLSLKAKGQAGDVVTIRSAQELDDEGAVRFNLRANCKYEEEWILSGGEDTLVWYDYKAFRYAELLLPCGVEVSDICLKSRHYPFECKAKLKDIYALDATLKQIWDLCVHTQAYGVQEVIQDCMEREKGFYLGDGCYSALTHMLLSGDNSMVKKLIDDAFASSFICDTLVTCMDCSFMQEIAEYPLIMVQLLLWHYRYTHDLAYLESNYTKAVSLLDAYRRDYEKDGLLRHLDKWCVVEWPMNFQHGYDADIKEGKICESAHVSINAYYIYAVKILNEIARILGKDFYRDPQPMLDVFYQAFYDKTTGLFFDSEGSRHTSLVGNSFVYAFDLCPSQDSKEAILHMIDGYGIDALSFFCTFPILMRFAKDGEAERLRDALSCDGAWKRMLREDATATFEGWGKDTKWNTSLFHMTMSYAAVFLSDVDLRALFE